MLCCLATRHSLDISVRRTESVRRDTQYILHHLLRPAELRDDFLVRQGRERRVTPGVNTKLVSAHVLFTSRVRELEDTRADGKERDLELLLVQILCDCEWTKDGAAISQMRLMLLRARRCGGRT